MGQRKVFQDLGGKQFGRLNVIRYLGTRGKNSYWECLCSCGRTTEVRGCSLRSGVQKSCGCYGAERNHRLHEEAETRNALREEQRAQHLVQKAAQRAQRQEERDRKTERKALQVKQRKAGRDESRISKWIREVYPSHSPINEQIASVIRRLQGHANKHEVAGFFDVTTKSVSDIWSGRGRWRPLTQDWDGLPVSSFEFPYFIPSDYYDLDQIRQRRQMEQANEEENRRANAGTAASAA